MVCVNRLASVPLFLLFSKVTELNSICQVFKHPHLSPFHFGIWISGMPKENIIWFQSSQETRRFFATDADLGSTQRNKNELVEYRLRDLAINSALSILLLCFTHLFVILMAYDTFSRVPLLSELFNDGHTAVKDPQKAIFFFFKSACPRIESKQSEMATAPG